MEMIAKEDLRPETSGPAAFPVTKELPPNEDVRDTALSKRRTWILSVLMLMLYVTLGTGAAQLTNLAFADPSLHFKAPYLFTMIKMMFRAQALTYYFIGNTVTKIFQRKHLHLGKTWRYSCRPRPSELPIAPGSSNRTAGIQKTAACSFFVRLVALATSGIIPLMEFFALKYLSRKTPHSCPRSGQQRVFLRRCKSIIGDDGITWRLVVFRFGPAAFFNLAVQILYTLSMANLTASVATALSAPAVAISYLFSWFFLKQPVLVLKVLFVGVAFAGVGLITYERFAETVSTSSIVGIVCVLGSDICLSSYQLAFKKAFPKGDFGQVSFAVTGMFTVMCLMYWPVPVALKCTGVEQYDIRRLPYGILFGAWICSSLAALMYGYGLVLANPFFMSISELLIMVATTVLDAAVRGVHIRSGQIIGSVLIGLAFVVVVLPDDLLRIRRIMGIIRREKRDVNAVAVCDPESKNMNAAAPKGCTEDLEEENVLKAFTGTKVAP